MFFPGGPSQGLGCICFYILIDFHLLFFCLWFVVFYLFYFSIGLNV